MRKLVFGLIVFFLLKLMASAAMPVDQFKPRTLASWEFSIRYSELYPKTDLDEAFDATLTSLSSEVEYTGKSRALSADKQRLVRKIGSQIVGRTDFAAAFVREIEVREGGMSYWLAVQREVFSHLEAELKRGEPFRVYYHFGGVARKKQPLYLMVEFDSKVASNAHP